MSHEFTQSSRVPNSRCACINMCNTDLCYTKRDAMIIAHICIQPIQASLKYVLLFLTNIISSIDGPNTVRFREFKGLNKKDAMKLYDLTCRTCSRVEMNIHNIKQFDS